MRVQGKNRNLHIGMVLPGSRYTSNLWSSVEGGRMGQRESFFGGRELSATIQRSDIGILRERKKAFNLEKFSVER